jgi:predicted SprT family Zn-dependent metalloprotease
MEFATNATSIVELEVSGARGPSESDQGEFSSKGNIVSASVESDRSLNEAIGKHATMTDWEYANLHADILIWAARFNREFFDGELPPAAVSFQADNIRRMGWYLLKRDGLALNYRININTKHLASGDQVDTLDTLLHEMVHQWEHVGGRTKGGRYHTKKFREKAEALGIPTDKYGYSLGPIPGGRFLTLLERYGVHLSMPPAPPAPASPPRPKSTISPWACDCTRVWVAAQTTLMAMCGKCGGQFVRAGSRTVGGG